MKLQEIINLFLTENELGELSQSGIHDFHHEHFTDFANENDLSLVWDSLNDEFIPVDNSICYLYKGDTLFTNEDEDDFIFLNDERYEESQSNLNYYDICELFDGGYEFKCNAFYGVIDHRGNQDWFLHSEEFFQFNETYYISYDVANENGIYHCERCDDYYDSNEGCEECVENDESYNFDYHSDYRTDRTTSETKFAIGFEVEKEDEDVKQTDYAMDLFNRTGWAKERDGSLDGDSGFELVSPTFDLFDNSILDSFKEVEIYLNAKSSGNCGGHINFSIKGLESSAMLKTVEGYLPLLYSMYERRLNVSFCVAKKAELLYSDRDKYQSVALKDNRIEFRIFPAVKSKIHLIWRLELIKIMANNPRTQVHEVLKDLCNKKSELYVHLLGIFTPEKIKEKTKLFIKYSLEIEEIGMEHLINDEFEYNVNEKPILPLPVRVFQVGDCVQIKPEVINRQYNSEYLNIIGIVTAANSKIVHIEFTHYSIDGSYNSKGDINTLNNVKHKDLIFMEDFPNMGEDLPNWRTYQINKKLTANNPDAIKIGDEVRVINHTRNPFCGFNIGTIARVEEVDGETIRIRENERSSIWVYDHQIEKVRKDIQVNDIVQVLHITPETEHIIPGQFVRVIRIREPEGFLNLVCENLDGSNFRNHRREYYLSTNQVELNNCFNHPPVGERIIQF